MGIRKAEPADWKAIANLLTQLGYPDTEAFIQQKLKILLTHPDEEIFVYEFEQQLAAFISIHFIPQIALKGDFARISYFSVAEDFRNKGIGRELEEICVSLARRRQCDRIEVHCHSRRKDAHRFYQRQGFIESPKYFIKELTEA